MKYEVTVKQESFGTILIEAETEEEAKRKAQDAWDNGEPFEPTVDAYDNEMKMEIVGVEEEKDE